MKVKEKVKYESAAAVKAVKEGTVQLTGAAGLFFWAFWGFLAAETRIGGGFSLCAAVTAAVSATNGTAAFAGSLAAFFLSGELGRAVTEIAAMPAIIISKAVMESASGKRLSYGLSGVHAGAAYFVCGVAAGFFGKMSAGLVIALLFRGALCGGAAYFVRKSRGSISKGFSLKEGERIPAIAVYALCVCMLCSVSLGNFNGGRAAGAFVSAAAAYLFGGGAGVTAAAVSSVAAGTADRSFLALSAVPVCSAAAAGMFRKRGRAAVSAAYIGAGLGCCLILGMPADSVRLLTDTVCAAAVFCLLPDRLCRLPLLKTAEASETARHFGGRLKFAAAAVADARKSFSEAARALERNEAPTDIAKQVCGSICARCRNSSVCSGGSERRIGTYFKSVEDFLEKKGYITERELSALTDICPNKGLLTEAFNGAYRRYALEKRLAAAAAELRELTPEYLEFAEKALDTLGGHWALFPACDEELSGRVREIFLEAGARDASVSVFYDEKGRLYSECLCAAPPALSPEELAEKLSAAAGRELDIPERFSAGGQTAFRFHEPAVFEAEIGSAAAKGRERTSGDFGTVFRDGFGSVTVLLSDGMGSGGRAAVESCMTVSLITRIMEAGLGAEAAVRLINLLLLTKSSEESFSTVDMLTVNLFTGRAELIKLGAAQSFIKTNGTVKTAEERAAPVGIVAQTELNCRSVQLSDGDEIVMLTDGVCEDCFPRVRELMLTAGCTARDCAERIISAAEKGMEEDIYRRDDKTVYVVKIHKI